MGTQNGHNVPFLESASLRKRKRKATKKNTYIYKISKREIFFNSQLNTSGREPGTCDTPVSYSIDKPTEEFKKYSDHWNTRLPPTIPAPTHKHIDKATNIYTHMNRHTDDEISEKE